MSNEIAERDDNAMSIFSSTEGFELAQRGAKLLSKSSLVPTDYRGSVANCVIALNMAKRMKADPLMVMQNLYIVHGKPGWSSQFLISTFNTSGRFSSIRYEFEGERGEDNWGCRAWTIEKETDERLESTLITIDMAKKEGWYSKKMSKWQTMPEQMLRYRSAAFLIRAYAPEIAMGMHTKEEIFDSTEPIDVTEDAQNEVEQNAFTEDIDLDTAEDIEESEEKELKTEGNSIEEETDFEDEPDFE